MHAVGMVAEFNPLHNGHVYALQAARRLAHADVVVVVMSGNFVQRGEPAIVDKWTRTRMALAAGADLVVELPVYDAVQSGSQFASGALAQLSSLGVASLAFGTEGPELDYMALARNVQSLLGEQRDEFTDYRQTYASQLAAAINHETGSEVTAPNQMLGLSYALANLELDQSLRLIPFGRQGVKHDAPELASSGTLASASAVRDRIRRGLGIDALAPASTLALLESVQPTSWQQLWPLLRYRLQTAAPTELAGIEQMAEGLEHRFQAAVGNAADFADFLGKVKSKRYTYARLRRLALAVTLNMRRDDVVRARQQRVTHVLGFTATGRTYLQQVKKHVALPLVSRVSRDMLEPDGEFGLIGRADALITTITGREQNYGRVPIMEDLNDA